MIVLSSVSGDRGRLKNYVYGSAKAGLNAYLQGLRARLYRSGSFVTTVKAGFIDTDMTFGAPGLFLVATPTACAEASAQAVGVATKNSPGAPKVISVSMNPALTVVTNEPERYSRARKPCR